MEFPAGTFRDEANSLSEAIRRFRETAHILRDSSGGHTARLAEPGDGVRSGTKLQTTAAECLGVLPGIYPEWLGDRGFGETHGVRFPYIGGDMARGISSRRFVAELGRAEMLGFYGAGGVGLDQLERTVRELVLDAGERYSFGVNLIHSPNDPELEAKTAQILETCEVRRVSASAYVALTEPLVRLAYRGVIELPSGLIQRRVSIFAKVSRPEVARAFLSPPDQALLDRLVAAGTLSSDEAALARRLPVAEDITVEADSGGHTDNQALGPLLPMILAERDRAVDAYGYTRPIRVGAAGGLGCPASVAAAFGLGAAYVLTGSINQASLEADVSLEAKRMLASASLGDTEMAPCADMFEQGVQVQVLRRGSLYASRAQRLYDLYRQYESLERIPAAERQELERTVFRRSLESAWSEVLAYFEERDPSELELAGRDARHRMALVFRWYLGKSSQWPIEGDLERRADYQLWCGPAMAAFNSWVKGSFLESLENRSAVQIAKNLLEGAATLTRAHQFRSHGVAVPRRAFQFRPRLLS